MFSSGKYFQSLELNRHLLAISILETMGDDPVKRLVTKKVSQPKKMVTSSSTDFSVLIFNTVSTAFWPSSILRRWFFSGGKISLAICVSRRKQIRRCSERLSDSQVVPERNKCQLTGEFTTDQPAP